LERRRPLPARSVLGPCGIGISGTRRARAVTSGQLWFIKIGPDLAVRSPSSTGAPLGGAFQTRDERRHLRGSRQAATAPRRDRKGRGGIVMEPEPVRASTAASTWAFPRILHSPSRPRISPKWPVAEFTRQRPEVRNLSRPPAQTSSPSPLPARLARRIARRLLIVLARARSAPLTLRAQIFARVGGLLVKHGVVDVWQPPPSMSVESSQLRQRLG
jgi:hypothetical protein